MANLPFWLEAGLAEAPQTQPVFPPPRGSGRMPMLDYAHDPFELAALRQREIVRPSGGRYWDDQTPIAVATSALDPLGITSFIGRFHQRRAISSARNMRAARLRRRRAILFPAVLLAPLLVAPSRRSRRRSRRRPRRWLRSWGSAAAPF